MQVASVVLIGLGVLIPSIRKLIDSVAYRNRARGKAELVRARRATAEGRRGPGRADG